MLLIIILGLIATLTSVCNGCDVGTQDVNNFDWNQAIGTWYLLEHSRNIVDDQIDCVVLNFASPVLNVSEVSLNVYIISLKRHVTFYGFVTNWNSQGYYDSYPQPTFWDGRYYVIATDYDSYLILKHCPFNLLQPIVYVSYRSPHPDNATVQEVMQELQENNIDASQLDQWKPDNCKQGESSTVKEVPHRLGIGLKPSTILNIPYN